MLVSIRQCEYEGFYHLISFSLICWFSQSMVKRPTLHDLATAAGVSIATVDRVINRRLPVSDDTSQRVVQAAEAIGYHATSLIKRRIHEMPVRRFGFLLQKPDAFYRQLGQELVAASRASHIVEVKPIVEFVDDVVPAIIAERLLQIAKKADAVAVVAMDHPVVNEAVESIIAMGKPVFTLLSNINSAACSGHFGADSRKCGRIAGWTISRLAKKPGKIGILVGSHGYLNQELSEISFRTYMREYATSFQLLEPIINLDDELITYEAVREMVADNADLVAVYVSGGGMEGMIRALREFCSPGQLVAVCNELTPATRAALHDGVIDLTLGTPFAALSRLLIEAMAKGTTSQDMPHLRPLMLPPDVFIPENI
jgi:LacI family transcriptional regulator